MWSQLSSGGSLVRIPHNCPVPALAVSFHHQQRRHRYQHQQQHEHQMEEHLCASESNGGDTPVGNQRSPASTFAGVRVGSYILSPVFEEYHSLWQWRTVMWREKLHAVPFLLYCAPGVPLRHPFIHGALVESITKSAATGRLRESASALKKPEVGVKQRYMSLAVPSPIGMLHSATSGPSACDPAAKWVNELFHFLEQGAAQTAGMPSYSSSTYTDVFKSGDATIPSLRGQTVLKKQHEQSRSANTADLNETSGSDNDVHHSTQRVLHSSWSVPLKNRNVIGCGLAEVVLAIDRYAAMLARREITYSKACWAVLVDSKADVQPYLRSSAVAIEKELIAATAAHEAVTAAVGDPARRPLLKLADYPALARW
ncbi:hypothetical protein MOQ_008622 [Trypanosoma cruzi marinkellei]|uniref:Uncharacterized protein n=1 Tax=Trypanosoma cruzi marinkellei TaxID=85056 RepID=K2LYF1_TRYCR|nr:hypothetical protein MOQ_008622 [Trypanosoma cruzi marinkellei]